jgi:hypothetical protein
MKKFHRNETLWHPIVHFAQLERRQVSIYLGTPSCISPGQAADKQDRKEKDVGQKAFWNGDRFLFTLAPYLAFARTGSR